MSSLTPRRRQRIVRAETSPRERGRARRQTRQGEGLRGRRLTPSPSHSSAVGPTLSLWEGFISHGARASGLALFALQFPTVPTTQAGGGGIGALQKEQQDPPRSRAHPNPL